MPKKQQPLLIVMLVTGLTWTVAPGATQEMERLWSDLGTGDAVNADRTIRALLAKPAETVAFLKSRLRPAPAARPCKKKASTSGNEKPPPKRARRTA